MNRLTERHNSPIGVAHLSADLSRTSPGLSATLPYEGRAKATMLPDGNARTPLSS